jgi:hypothetical protein
MRGIRTPVSTVVTPALLRILSISAGVLGVAVADEESDLRLGYGVFDVHEQVADGLCHPGVRGVRGSAEYKGEVVAGRVAEA